MNLKILGSNKNNIPITFIKRTDGMINNFYLLHLKCKVPNSEKNLESLNNISMIIEDGRVVFVINVHLTHTIRGGSEHLNQTIGHDMIYLLDGVFNFCDKLKKDHRIEIIHEFILLGDFNYVWFSDNSKQKLIEYLNKNNININNIYPDFDLICSNYNSTNKYKSDGMYYKESKIFFPKDSSAFSDHSILCSYP